MINLYNIITLIQYNSHYKILFTIWYIYNRLFLSMKKGLSSIYSFESFKVRNGLNYLNFKKINSNGRYQENKSSSLLRMNFCVNRLIVRSLKIVYSKLNISHQRNIIRRAFLNASLNIGKGRRLRIFVINQPHDSDYITQVDSI